jgi:hypothetical protein
MAAQYQWAAYISGAKTRVKDGPIGNQFQSLSIVFVCAVRHEAARSVPKFLVLSFKEEFYGLISDMVRQKRLQLAGENGIRNVNFRHLGFTFLIGRN